MADARQFAKLDLGYFDNPKVADFVDEHPHVPILHLRAILYSRQHLTDGLFPIRLVVRMASATYCGSQCDAECDYCRGVSVGLFDRVNDRQGMVHDYLEHQQSSEDVKRLSNAGKKGAAARWGSESDADRNADRNGTPNAEANAERGEERRGDLALVASPEPDRFEEFWDAYGKKDGKKAASPKWATALKKKGVTPDMLIEAAKRYIAHQRATNKHPEFTKNASTWLNGEHWNDEIPAGTRPVKASGWWNA